MKTVLSYHHARKMSAKPDQKASGDIPESFVHFMVPLCAVVTRGHASMVTAGGGGEGATASADTKSGGGGASRQQTIELMIEALVEMFESALEAGLKDFADVGDASGGDGDGSGNGTLRNGVKASHGSSGATKVQTNGDTGGGSGAEERGEGDAKFPAWVGVVYGVLVPPLQGLVDHVTRVHLGLEVTADVSEEENETKNSLSDNDNSSSSSSKATGAVVGTVVTTDIPTTETVHDNGDSGTTLPPEPRGSARGGPESSRREEANANDDSIEPNDTDTDKHQAAGEEGKRRPTTEAISKSNSETAATAETAVSPPSRRRSSARRPSQNSRRRSSANTSSHRSSPRSPRSPRTARANVGRMATSAHQARAALWDLLKPLVSMGLVGYLGADECLFVWDQAVIGGFGAMLPRATAMLLAAAKGKLEACGTFARMSEALLSHARLVSVRGRERERRRMMGKCTSNACRTYCTRVVGTEVYK